MGLHASMMRRGAERVGCMPALLLLMRAAKNRLEAVVRSTAVGGGMKAQRDRASFLLCLLVHACATTVAFVDPPQRWLHAVERRAADAAGPITVAGALLTGCAHTRSLEYDLRVTHGTADMTILSFATQGARATRASDESGGVQTAHRHGCYPAAHGGAACTGRAAACALVRRQARRHITRVAVRVAGHTGAGGARRGGGRTGSGAGRCVHLFP